MQAEGIILAVVGWPGGFDLALESLDLRRSGIELLSVRPSRSEHEGEVAAVFVPDDKVNHFFSRLDEFANETTPQGNPKHQKLIANIASLQNATLRQLWTDQKAIPESGIHWFEVWLRRTGSEQIWMGKLSQRFDWQVAATRIYFPGRTVAAIRADIEELGKALASMLPLAEVRFASLAQSPAELPPETQRAWVNELVQRIGPASAAAPAVCLMDTGVYRHTLFNGSLGPSDVHHTVGPDGQDRLGHGTQMAGLALFGDLTDALTSHDQVRLAHRLESVKVLPDPEALPNRPETFGAVTASGAAIPEANAPSRKRSFCLANSHRDHHYEGRPSLWSATVDALCFGTDVVISDGGIELLSEPDPESSRLFVVAAGNVRDDYCHDYLDTCDTSVIEDPGQAWNALTVGAFTDLDQVPQSDDFTGYRALALKGDLSPFSRTSQLLSKPWPIKPDIVMEGGNLLVSRDGSHFDQHDVVSVTTTSHLEALGKPLTTANATSAAAAQAARLAGMTQAHYPEFWPETIRGLLVHAAEWTPPMASTIDAAPNKSAKLQLIKRYGFGCPTVDRVLNSASNAVTLIAQAHIQPFESADSSRTRLREMHLHDLPWPRDLLLDLGSTDVRLRVTLSYFVEPNASSRGWQGRYAYSSHGLRFDIRRPGETTAGFQTRLNALAETEEGRSQRGGEQEPHWVLGPKARHVGSLHADLWEGNAADLADCGVLGVYPVGGWWKNNNRSDRNEMQVRYALLVSLYTAETEIDLYSPISAQIGIPIETS